MEVRHRRGVPKFAPLDLDHGVLVKLGSRKRGASLCPKGTCQSRNSIALSPEVVLQPGREQGCPSTLWPAPARLPLLLTWVYRAQ